MDDRLESMYRRFTWRILSNYVSPWEFEQLREQITDYEQWCGAWCRQAEGHVQRGDEALAAGRRLTAGDAYLRAGLDRKSTRLNSSHLGISYAVFCLKKKKHKIVSE